MFVCLECNRKFKTVKAAEKASCNGCPGCGGVDIDVAAHAPKEPVPVKPVNPKPAAGQVSSVKLVKPQETETVTIQAPGGLSATIEVTKTGTFLFNGVEIDVYSNEKGA